MSAAWHGGLARHLVASDGSAITVVYRGTWSHGFGPDFTDAMIDFGDGQLVTGAVEIHRDASDWERHGHHRDPAYNAVILHVVSRLDLPETRREDGNLVPTVVLDVPEADLFAIDQELPSIWDALGKSACAEDLAFRQPQRLRAALNHLGGQRFSQRVAAAEGELSHRLLSDILLGQLAGAFGYSQNREQMSSLLDRLIESGGPSAIGSAHTDERFELAATHLFGLGGFLPMAPPDAALSHLGHVQLAAIEERWQAVGPRFAHAVMPATAWVRSRTRPANHPVARIASFAALLAATAGDPSLILLEAARDGALIHERLRTLTSRPGVSGLGHARAIAITASVILPTAMAWAHHTGDAELEDAVSHAWATLPRSEWSQPARRALAQAVGEAPIGTIGERAIQGLLHLNRALCTPRHCISCPIAAEVIRDRQRDRISAPAPVQSVLPT
jgi:hypothetical protein